MPEPSDSNEFFAIMNTLGHASLIETLKAAAHYVTHSNMALSKKSFSWRLEIDDCKSCYFFVQGTGLETLIHDYGLEYDAEVIREKFNYYVRRSV